MCPLIKHSSKARHFCFCQRCHSTLQYRRDRLLLLWHCQTGPFLLFLHAWGYSKERSKIKLAWKWREITVYTEGKYEVCSVGTVHRASSGETDYKLHNSLGKHVCTMKNSLNNIDFTGSLATSQTGWITFLNKIYTHEWHLFCWVKWKIRFLIKFYSTQCTLSTQLLAKAQKLKSQLLVCSKNSQHATGQNFIWNGFILGICAIYTRRMQLRGSVTQFHSNGQITLSLEKKNMLFSVHAYQRKKKVCSDLIFMKECF